ncbi:MAG: hypothetical protein JSV79_12125 [Armatimonadota bacterium]|nr:MAG: hypothetical protein JSV79_12125 [Armatimonadota bacterium]
MNRSVPTMLGIVIILLVVVLVVLIINYRVTRGIGAGEELVGTTATGMLAGQQPPEEVIDEASALGGRVDRPEPQVSPALRADTPAAEKRRERQTLRQGGEPIGQRERPGQPTGPPGAPD